ncbi:unnamed protein product [Ophioblennius macclurei]
MPRHCSAGGCKSRDNRETRNAGITFHKLPKGATRRNLWISNSHRTDPWDPQTDFVYFCSKHFTPQSFELTGCSGIRRLKEDAFPSVFELTSGTKGRRAAGLQRREDSPRNRRRSRSAQPGTSSDEAKEEDSAQRTTSAETSTKSSDEPPKVQLAPPTPELRPLSPSCYMRRLPPPAGFYLSREHSYAQPGPLLWRRRYDQVVDCLEKALRQLRAARRRESRLRSAMLRLRDRRTRTPLLSPQTLQEPDPKESLTAEPDCWWSEEEKALCLHCGRGQTDSRMVPPAEDEGQLQLHSSSGPTPWTSADGAVMIRELHLDSGVKEEIGAPALDLPLQHQVLLMEDSTEGQLVLVPVHSPEGLQDLQTILVSELDLQVDGTLPTDNRQGPCDEDSLVQQPVIRGPIGEAREDVREMLKEHLEGFHLQLSTQFTP